MTKREIANLLGYSEINLYPIFNTMAQTRPETLIKLKSYNKKREVDFSLEECLAALRLIPTFTLAQERFLKENFIYRNELYKYNDTKLKLPTSARVLIHDLSTFVRFKNNKVRCCATCAYLMRRNTLNSGTKTRPFCTLHNLFMHKIKDKVTKQSIDIYKSNCLGFLHTTNYYEPPLIWDIKGNPIDFEFNGTKFVPVTKKTTLGISNDKFTTGKSKSDEILILKDAFATDSE